MEETIIYCIALSPNLRLLRDREGEEGKGINVIALKFEQEKYDCGSSRTKASRGQKFMVLLWRIPHST